MKALLIYDQGSADLAKQLAKKMDCKSFLLTQHHFPDGETLVRVPGISGNQKAYLVLRLDRPNEKLFPLILIASTLRKQGIKHITLIAPYLPYMRQDKAFHAGEAVAAPEFAKIISQYFDRLITLDPHLHRIANLKEIFSIPTVTLTAAPLLAEYIAKKIKQPLLIGPDSESAQWVSQVAREKTLDYVVLKKQRYSDTKVKIIWDKKIPVKGRTAVLVDDIISSGATMIEVVKQLRQAGFTKVACLAVHAVFANDAFKKIKQAGATHLATSNTIVHSTNKINIAALIGGVL